MITPEEFKQAQDTVRCLIEVIFKHEGKFKEKFLTKSETGCDCDEFSLLTCYMSGHSLRLEILHDDLSERTIFLNVLHVFSWYDDLGESLGFK